jgi:hypothetical protein
METKLAEVCKWLTFWQEEWMKRGYRGEKQGESGYLPTNVFEQGHPGLIISQALQQKYSQLSVKQQQRMESYDTKEGFKLGICSTTATLLHYLFTAQL